MTARNPPPPENSGAAWRLVLGLLGHHRRAVAVYGASMGLATALPLAGAVLLARFVDLVVDGAPTTRLVPVAAGYAAIGAASAALTVVVTWRTTALAWALTDDLRRDLARHVLDADLAFHRDRTPGELVTRVDADVTAMTQFLSRVVSRVIAIGLLAVGAVSVLAVLEWRLAVPLAAGFTGVAAATWSQRNSAMAATVAERRAEAEVMSTTEEYLAAADEVAALGAGAHGVAKLADRSARLVDAIGRRVRVQMRVQGTIRLSIVATEVLVLAVGAVLLAGGTIGVGAVFLGFRFVVVVRQPLEGLTWRLQEAQGASGAARRVLDLLDEWRAVPGGSARLPTGPLEIVLRDLVLVYDDEDGDQHEHEHGRGAAAPALDHVDLTLPAGRTLGVVGRTGSGKTSLARLILRLVAPSAGTVHVGGVDLADVDETDLRRRVAAVPQDVQLFPGTVADNVGLFEPFADDQVVDALTAVGLGPWLRSLPNGIATRLGTAGDAATGLSAGQAQLLALARGLLRSPDVVVLDEATSRVDPATQAAIAGATAELVRGRTAVIIAHRLETLSVCDDIAVLADGRLVEHGPRAKLAADPSSRYAGLLATAALAEEAT